MVELDESKRQRLKELEKMKRTLLTKMKRHRKELAKCKLSKRRINEEISRILSGASHDMGSRQAFSAVATAIKDTTPEDLYPKDLEREFDRIERTMKGPNERVTDVDDELEEFGVVDMSDEGGSEDDTTEPTGEEDDL